MPEDKDIDLERCVTPPMSQGSDCQPSSDSKAGRNCAIAVQFLDGRAVLINATITEEVGGGLVFGSAKKQIVRAVTTKWHQKPTGNFLTSLVVGTAIVKQVHKSSSGQRSVFLPYADISPQKVIQCGPSISPPRVYLQDFTLDPLLTEALHNPQILLQSAAYPLNAGYFGSSPTDNDKSTSTYLENVDQEVIVVRRVIDRAKVAWLLILLLLFSPALGIGVGICSHNADVGIAVSAGVFALASFVQGLVAWVQG